MGDFMIIKFFHIIKKVILAALFIYSFDVFAISLNLSIPINFFTILLVTFFDVPAMFCLVLFSIVF